MTNEVLVLAKPTPADFRALSVLQESAFPEQDRKHNLLRYQRYYRECPVKLEYCRIVKRLVRKDDGDKNKQTDPQQQQQLVVGDTDPATSSTGTVIAACQLEVRGGVGVGGAKDANPQQQDRVFIEWIGCHPDHRGKGVGSMLLDWAGTFARDHLQTQKLGLYMVRSNTNARRLYERNGFASVSSSSAAASSSSKAKKNYDNNNGNNTSKSSSGNKRFQRRLDRLFGHWSIVQMEKIL